MVEKSKAALYCNKGYTIPVFFRLKEDVDFSTVAHKCLTIKQGNCLLKKEDDDVIVLGNLIGAYFPQEESLMLKEGRAEVHVQWTYTSEDNGSPLRGGVLGKYYINIDDNHITEVMS